MSRTCLLYPLSAALATALVLAACKKPEPIPPPAPLATEPAPAATTLPSATPASVTALELGNSVGADERVTAPATTFAPGDTIYASVTTRTGDPTATVPGRLSAKWTFQDGQTVHEDARDLTLTGDGTTTFQISRPGGFPVGRYTVEISLDGAVVQSREFEVK
ncbi:hypothetical protein [Pseudoxanthomonas suwonensis]|uniref:PKD domain-containing protein n=1 Tax=Pseudoxanthomonas suwonensis TaxID=314722 RepID=A0A0E3UMW7_9GAMM|nr:hypothetical protein [Pseudoxanthomonas suwonensis]AKC86666.1 hypothetical protein WQ53_07715 [Pseudoxanthomonas suwonensis]